VSIALRPPCHFAGFLLADGSRASRIRGLVCSGRHSGGEVAGTRCFRQRSSRREVYFLPFPVAGSVRAVGRSDMDLV